MELFIIEYQCSSCKQQWVCTFGKVEPLIDCNLCGNLARAKDVVSFFFGFPFSSIKLLLAILKLNWLKLIVYLQWRKLTWIKCRLLLKRKNLIERIWWPSKCSEADKKPNAPKLNKTRRTIIYIYFSFISQKKSFFFSYKIGKL